MASAPPFPMAQSQPNHPTTETHPTSLQRINSQKKVPSASSRRVPPPSINGRQKQFLKTRAKSDLAPLINAGMRLSRQDPNIRSLMTERAFKSRHHYHSPLSVSGGSNNNNSGKSAASNPLGPIWEQTLFESVFELPDLQGDDTLTMMASMRSRSGTNDSAGRRRRKRCVSVSESELVQVLAGGCQSCNSILSLYGVMNGMTGMAPFCWKEREFVRKSLVSSSMVW